MQATLTDTRAFSLPIQRGFSRLSAVYVTFWKQGTRFVTDFSSPYLVQQPYNQDNDKFRFQLQLGGDLKPTYRVQSAGELFYRLRMCQGIHTGNDSMSIDFNKYQQGNEFIIGMTLEKTLGAEAVHTGVSTFGGQLLYIHLKNIQDLAPSAASVCVVCHYDAVLTITSGGCELAY